MRKFLGRISPSISSNDLEDYVKRLYAENGGESVEVSCEDFAIVQRLRGKDTKPTFKNWVIQVEMNPSTMGKDDVLTDKFSEALETKGAIIRRWKGAMPSELHDAEQNTPIQPSQRMVASLE